MSDEAKDNALEDLPEGFPYNDPNPPRWPNNKIPFNRWFTGLHAFIYQLQHNFDWHKHKRFGAVKYINIRIDTRNGNFLVFCEGADGKSQEQISPDELGINFERVFVRKT